MNNRTHIFAILFNKIQNAFMSGDKMMMLIMFGLFLFLAATMIAITWYNKKYKSKIDPVRILLILFAIIVVGFALLIKKLNT